MSDWAALFGDFDGRLWLNTADQGPLPLPAAMAAIQALEWKVYPSRLSTDEYQRVPIRLREMLRSLLGATDGQIILGNSTTYGLSIIARALRWNSRDQVLLVEGDFPANFTPWLGLCREIEARIIQRELWAMDPCGALRSHLQENTRVFCATWVDSFTGRMVNLKELGGICHANGTYFVVNASQGLGNRSFDVAGLPIDALTSSGSKWLCGPYGTGFCWVGEEMSASMLPVQYYWQANRNERSLSGPVPSDIGVDNATYDIFAPANFLNYVPWTVALECLLKIGIHSVAIHIDEWIRSFRSTFDITDFQLTGSDGSVGNSALIYVTHKFPERNELAFQHLKKAGIDVALRRGKIRISPHIFNAIESSSLVVDSLRRARSLCL